nr:MAG TPA: hypothetical protein [Caudoviricetes sp.]
MEYTYKQIQDYFYNNNLEQSDTIFNDMDSIAYVLCEVLTPSEKARAKKAVKNGGFFTFGYNGLYCCNSLKKSTVHRFFKVNYNLDIKL